MSINYIYKMDIVCEFIHKIHIVQKLKTMNLLLQLFKI